MKERFEGASCARVAKLTERVRRRVTNVWVGVLRERDEAVIRLLDAHGAKHFCGAPAYACRVVAREAHEARAVRERVDAPRGAECRELHACIAITECLRQCAASVVVEAAESGGRCRSYVGVGVAMDRGSARVDSRRCEKLAERVRRLSTARRTRIALEGLDRSLC